MRKTAIVTGASRGIGRSIALRLAADGFGVVVNYAGNAAKAEEVVNEITSSGGRALAVQADVANPEDVKQLFDKTLKAFGQIDVVVNNAGIMPMSPIAKKLYRHLRQGDCHQSSRHISRTRPSCTACSSRWPHHCVFKQCAS